MKRSIAIVLLGLQLFTICGHMVLYQYFVYRSDRLFNEQIRKNLYNVNDLVEIRIPVHSSTAEEWSSYENIQGQIQFKSTSYNYVKLKLTKDSLFLFCVPNYETTRLNQQNIIDAKDITDIAINKKDHVSFGKLIDLGGYHYPITIFNFTSGIAFLNNVENKLSCSPVNQCLAIPELPPKMLC